MEYYSVLKKKSVIKPWKDMENLKWIIIKWKKSIWKGFLHTIWFQLYAVLEQAKTLQPAKRSEVARRRGRRNEQGEHRDFLGQWKYSVHIMVDSYYYTFDQIYEMDNTKNEP